MSLKEQLQKDMVVAMKAKDELLLNVIRLLRGMVRKLEIDQKRELDDNDIIGVLTNAAKQRREAIKAYTEGGRADLVKQEEAELAIISEYLPKAMGMDELDQIIATVISETGATSMQDIGKVMPKIMQQVKGRADGAQIQIIVRSKLS
ncbi:MAG: GatB/YqeY domain-containing protein [Candidatus Marinimicrobia bacterium]|nr:GatB/YqeY domain-containing protein [Candidatus Neomarinimicrobiota bacterium]